MNTERQAAYTPGPRFFEENGEELFEFQIDHGNRHGPRRATDADKEKYPEAYKAFKNPPPKGEDAKVETPGLKEYLEAQDKVEGAKAKKPVTEKTDEDKKKDAEKKQTAAAPPPSSRR